MFPKDRTKVRFVHFPNFCWVHPFRKDQPINEVVNRYLAGLWNEVSHVQANTVFAATAVTASNTVFVHHAVKSAWFRHR